jgi:hypothetical protein
MRANSRRMLVILAVACGAAALAASALARSAAPAQQLPIRAVLNGVLDVAPSKKAKTALERFNFLIHVSRAGVVTGHGDFNGGSGKYISLSQITSFSCSANAMVANAMATLNTTQEVVPVSISAQDHGVGIGSSGDTFTISFGKWTWSGSPVDGKVFIKNCPAG